VRDLAGYRKYVRDYLDLDATDMSDELVDAWVQDGYRRIIQVIRRWPFFEAEANITTEVGVQAYTLEVDFDNIVSVDGTWGTLDFLDHSQARERFHLFGSSVSQGHARAWSMWAGQFHVWPVPDAGETLTIVGWRSPQDWVSGHEAGAVPDFPADFEDALVLWTLRMAHLHQEDIDLAEIDRQNFQDRLDELVQHHTQTPTAFPVIVGGGYGRRASQLPSRFLYPWE
jgi:hypothetical protein